MENALKLLPVEHSKKRLVYTINYEGLLMTQSSSYLAISKVDGRVVQKGSLMDEG